ncbi:DNA mismatch repair protein [Pedobacter sp. MC2016-24]|uniref:MutS-related protein n=1 Tax=Pedobacter sp. MC2016-24 TaxID=2780090 RepID=UPI0018804EEB|nr:DNA mismatch repair protein [Pedobacter sp. MC2016-24]MBE9602434.1 DNA mismatch repair protein [Pedobacter sp. MC2016-24]
MSFLVDKQTLDDLNVFNKKARDSVFGLFNRTRTRGGAEILEQMFRYPSSDAGLINQRSEVILYFKHTELAFPFREEWFDLIEHYLDHADERSKLSGEDNKLGRALNQLIGADAQYKEIAKGVGAVVDLLSAFRQFLGNMSRDPKHPYQQELNAIAQILESPTLQRIGTEAATGKYNYEKTADHDQVLRFHNKEQIRKLLSFAYQLDVYLAVAKVADQQGFVFPKALAAGNMELKVKGLYHPLIENAVGNDLLAGPEKSVIFLTGANMAGKSTLMKSLGIAVFLAHMGFPVAAKHMEFPVMDGLFSTINLPDNLSMGYSHFYAEVLRVKKVAEQLAQKKRLFVIFDELFRGTNVKDAYEATVALTTAFAGKTDSIFVISTHIIEAGAVLQERCANIQFRYLPTLMADTKPVYTYQLEQGITADRHGMLIIGNEGIIEILKNKKNRGQ